MDSIGAIGTAVAGMSAARLRMDVAAAVLATVVAAPSSGAVGGSAGGAGEVDVAAALVEQMLALAHFGANAAVARTADELAAATLRLADGMAPE